MFRVYVFFFGLFLCWRLGGLGQSTTTSSCQEPCDCAKDFQREYTLGPVPVLEFDVRKFHDPDGRTDHVGPHPDVLVGLLRHRQRLLDLFYHIKVCRWTQHSPPIHPIVRAPVRNRPSPHTPSRKSARRRPTR